MNQNQNVFLLDAGGTFLKGAVMRAEGLSPVKRETMPPFTEIEPGAKEIDPEDIASRLERLIFKMSSEFGSPTSLRLTGQMGGLVLLGLDGRPLTNIRSWQDTRTHYSGRNTPSTWEVFRNDYLSDFSQGSGNDIKPSTTVVQLLNQLSINQLNVQFRPLTLLGYLANHLAGTLDRPTVHISDAAATGMYDIFDEEFNFDAIGRLTKFSVMPQVQSSYVPIEIGAKSSVPVMVGVGDQQASLFGVELSADSIVVNVGTGGQVASLVPEPSNRSNNGIQIRPYFFGSKISTITHLPAGRITSRLVSKLFGSETPNSFTDFFAQSDSSGDVIPINLEDLDLKELAATKPDSEIVARSFLHEMVKRYESEIKLLDPTGEKRMIFAGGLGQKFSQFSDALALRTGRNKKISNQTETTLAGLGRLELGN